MNTTASRPLELEVQAENLVNSYIGWSVGAGFIPIPLIDLAAIGTVQMKMLADLAKIYDVPFSRNLAKSVIGALVGSGGTVALTIPAASLIKVVPIVGHIASFFTEPTLAAAATYALGKVFIQHFASGGTFLDFNPEAVRKYYEEHFAAAQSGAIKPPTAASAKP